MKVTMPPLIEQTLDDDASTAIVGAVPDEAVAAGV
jgi:hypothetical protein